MTTAATMVAAVVQSPGRLELQEVALPHPGAGEVRIRVRAAGVCGTDLHIYRGQFGAVLPLIPGHEIAGVIDAVGPGVRDLAEGQLVALDPVISCGTCLHCRRGLRQHCLRYQALGVTRAGGFARYLVAPATCAYPADGLPADVAAFAEPLGCIAWGMLRLRPEPGSRALLYGAGPIGLLLLQGLLASGVASVTVVDPVEGRLRVASELGAARTLRAGPEAEAALADLEPTGFEVVAEATGRPEVVEALPRHAAVGGRLLIFGVGPEEATVRLNPYQIYRRDLTLLGSFSLNGNVPAALTWLRSGRVRVEPLITHRLPVSGLEQALDFKSHPGMADALKVIVQPN